MSVIGKCRSRGIRLVVWWSLQIGCVVGDGECGLVGMEGVRQSVIGRGVSGVCRKGVRLFAEYSCGLDFVGWRLVCGL